VTAPDSLELAASPSAPVLARTFTAGLLRLRGFGEAAVSATRLAVSELSAATVSSGAARLSIEVTDTTHGVVVDVSADAELTGLDELARRIVDDAGTLATRPDGWSLDIARRTP
jgi:hypothetical protein